MVALSQGDRAAFRPVYEALWPLLRGFSLAWALGFASFEVMSQRKRTARRNRLRPLIPQAAPAETPEERLLESDLRAAAAEALGRLRPADLETLETVFREQRPAPPRPSASGCSARWISIESKCCQPITSALALPPQPSGELWLRLTGGEGVKEFLAAELEALNLRP